MTAAIEARNIRLVAGGRPVLKDATFTIAGGEFVAVLGPNGAGKTTLFRALLGLQPVAAGTLSVLGAPPRRGQPGIGYLPQARSAPGALRLTGRDLVASAVGGHRWGVPWPSPARREEVARVLAATDTLSIADRPFGALSGGERQRLFLAAALVGSPQLLVLDEPLMSLDPARQDETVALADDLRRRLGLTVLLSAHEINPLIGVAGRVLYLGGGSLAIGTVAEVVTPPVLSRLYGTPIEVVEASGRLTVLAGGRDVERHAHAHAHHGHGHGAAS